MELGLLSSWQGRQFLAFLRILSSTFAIDNSVIVVGGVTELLLQDYFSSPITNVSEILGCNEEVTLPNYPLTTFGAILGLIKAIMNILGWDIW